MKTVTFKSLLRMAKANLVELAYEADSQLAFSQLQDLTKVELVNEIMALIDEAVNPPVSKPFAPHPYPVPAWYPAKGDSGSSFFRNTRGQRRRYMLESWGCQPHECDI